MLTSKNGFTQILHKYNHAVGEAMLLVSSPRLMSRQQVDSGEDGRQLFVSSFDMEIISFAAIKLYSGI